MAESGSDGSKVRTVEPLMLGPMMVGRRSRTTPAPDPQASAAEFVAIYFPAVGEDLIAEAHVAEDLSQPAALAGREIIALVAPQRFLAGVLPVGRPSGRLPRSACLGLAQRYLAGLLELGGEPLCDRQAGLAAEAVRSLLAAARTPGDEQGLGSRRRVSLLERAVEHIDAHLHAALSVTSLCEALYCSRSAIYRATEGAGGVAGLIEHRRMSAVRERLRDPHERRPIADVAAEYGFCDAAQFSRRFKAVYGEPPGALRRMLAQRSPAADRHRVARRALSRRAACR